MPTKCDCCKHPDADHLDEGGIYIGCWACEYERIRIREMAWTTSRIRRWLHDVLNYHIWFDSHCTRCGIKHP